MITIGVMAIGTTIGMAIIGAGAVGDHHGDGAGTAGTDRVGTLDGEVGTVHGIAHGMAAIMATTIGTEAITTIITTTMAEEEVLPMVIMPEIEQTVQDMASEMHLIIVEEVIALLDQEIQTSAQRETTTALQEIILPVREITTTVVLPDKIRIPHSPETT